jgi:hypothetical protein
MNDQLFATREIRKKLWWMLPFFSTMAVLAWTATFYFVAPSVQELLHLTPSVRIEPAGLLAPVFGVLCTVIVVLSLVRAIPYNGIWSKRLEWLMNGIVFSAGGLVVLIIFGSSLVQDHYMPKLGYVRCDLLQGNPTLWFTDWVKNPDWCVQSKTREWVNEQAKLISK